MNMNVLVSGALKPAKYQDRAPERAKAENMEMRMGKVKVPFVD
jgi:hypothetical protein